MRTRLQNRLDLDGSDEPWWEEEEETEEESSTLFRDLRGTPRRLGPILFSGGEGVVRAVADDTGKLVKTYHRRILENEERTGAIQSKIRAMLKMNDMRADLRFGWPQAPVFDERGNWAGYAMRRCPGIVLHNLCAPASMRNAFPKWDRKDLVKVCLSLVDGLNALHRNGASIGDVNTGNFLVEPDASVSFIDCDSYCVKDADGKALPCEVRTDLFTPPELFGISPREAKRNPGHELFSDAVLFYQVLMLGAHPYSRRFGEDPVSNLRSGQCPLGRGTDCSLPRGRWYNLWSHLTYNLKTLFVRAFREGHADPTARPDLPEWKQALKQFLFALEASETSNSSELDPAKPKSDAYRGRDKGIAAAKRKEESDRAFFRRR